MADKLCESVKKVRAADCRDRRIALLGCRQSRHIDTNRLALPCLRIGAHLESDRLAHGGVIALAQCTLT